MCYIIQSYVRTINRVFAVHDIFLSDKIAICTYTYLYNIIRRPQTIIIIYPIYTWNNNSNNNNSNKAMTNIIILYTRAYI